MKYLMIEPLVLGGSTGEIFDIVFQVDIAGTIIATNRNFNYRLIKTRPPSRSSRRCRKSSKCSLRSTPPEFHPACPAKIRLCSGHKYHLLTCVHTQYLKRMLLCDYTIGSITLKLNLARIRGSVCLSGREAVSVDD